MEEKVDLVVVGAGWHGLAAAKAHLDLHPSAQVLVLDQEKSIGGTWAKERLYPGLKSNNMLGTYEYSDFPMDTETYGVKPGEHIPGEVIHRYLGNYAQHYGFYAQIRFQTKVNTAEHQQDSGWLLKCSRDNKVGGTPEESRIVTSKLIVAAGLTSEPLMPNFRGEQTFEAPLFHCKYLQERADLISTAKSVAVLGATKSAWDTAYAFASKGVKVDMIIRESGHGPCWMSPPYVTPLKKWLEKLVETRFLTWLSPCIWGDVDGFPGIRSFLHGTAIGRFIVNGFWSILGNDVKTLNKFDSHPETAKLSPWSNPMFIGAGLSILNYDTDFFELVRNGTISVHVSDVAELTPKVVCLTNGAKLPADAFICCTGWKQYPSIEFLPRDMDLGLPHAPNSLEPISTIKLTQQADKEILTKFPRLVDQPKANPKAKPLGIGEPLIVTPYRLFRFMVPPSTTFQRDIAFAGYMMTISTVNGAEIQALWIAAYFNGQLPLPEDIEYQTILHSRFGKWRTPAGFGAKWPDLAFDTLPYQTLLLNDMGLKIHRKGSLMKEIFEPYGGADYKGLVDEWKALHKVE